MAVRDIAIACQGGGSHAAYTGGVLPVLLGELDNLRVAREADDALRMPGDPEVGALVAISGTSGGAISALLGWYGFITGGAGDAERRLDAFWTANSAQKWNEAQLNHMARTLADLAANWGWDIKSSPYSLPMAMLETFSGAMWPLMARALGPDNPWMRPDFFALPALLNPGVDWPLVGAIGEFASIPLDVQRWIRSDLEAAIFPPEAPCRQRQRAEREAIEGRIVAKLGCAARIAARMDDLRLGDDALLRAAFARWREPALRFDAAALGELAAAVQRVTRHIPHLLVGAVELHQGEFIAFSSERAPDDGGISLDAVLASAAVPWLFRAREMTALDERSAAPRRLALWDGLFSQNPPIKNFLSGVLDDSKKPDEIWVVQINPSAARIEPGKLPAAARRVLLSGGEIWDLRNALAGNLALNQELGFVDAINRRMDEAPPDGRHARATPGASDQRVDRQVQVDRIVMDGDAVGAAAGADLGANSKLDRDPRLRAALYHHGRLQAQRYIGLRSRIGSLCGDLGATLACACGTAAGLGPHGGAPARIEGQSELAEVPDAGSGWRLKEVSITAVTPLAGRVALPVRPALPGALQPRRRPRDEVGRGGGMLH